MQIYCLFVHKALLAYSIDHSHGLLFSGLTNEQYKIFSVSKAISNAEDSGTLFDTWYYSYFPLNSNNFENLQHPKFERQLFKMC